MSITYPKDYFEEGFTLENPFMTRGRREAWQDSLNSEDYITPLSEEEKVQYDAWVKEMKDSGKMHPGNENYDYDMQGFWKNEVVPKTKEGMSSSAETHFTDKYKNPKHRTYSVESQYINDENRKYAGNWKKWEEAQQKQQPANTTSILGG